jgi:hypothetical protein
MMLGLAGEVGEEDVAPDRRAGSGPNVLDVEDIVFEFLIEDAGLDLEAGLRVLELVFEAKQIARRSRDEVERVDQA